MRPSVKVLETMGGWSLLCFSASPAGNAAGRVKTRPAMKDGWTTHGRCQRLPLQMYQRSAAGVVPKPPPGRLPFVGTRLAGRARCRRPALSPSFALARRVRRAHGNCLYRLLSRSRLGLDRGYGHCGRGLDVPAQSYCSCPRLHSLAAIACVCGEGGAGGADGVRPPRSLPPFRLPLKGKCFSDAVPAGERAVGSMHLQFPAC